jgi:hypothetical protein
MRNPLQRLKYLPWLPLAQVASLTVFLSIVFEILLRVGYVQSTLVQRSLNILLAPPLGLLLVLAISAGMGAIAVWMLEVLYPRVIINSGVLWALIFCLLVCVALKTLFPVPTFLISLDQVLLIGLLLGVFGRGRRYWR